MITYDQFLNSISTNDYPSEDLSDCLKSLWWSQKGDWNKAHDLAQEEGSKDGDWVHAYLHRLEGDLGNAAYWYNRASRQIKRNENLDEEWEELAKYFLG